MCVCVCVCVCVLNRKNVCKSLNKYMYIFIFPNTQPCDF